MPVIGISVKQLNSLLGKTLSPEQLSDTLEKLGCDLEGMAEVVLYRCEQCGSLIDKLEHEEAIKRCGNCGHEAALPFTETGRDQVIRLDLLPARPDFFDAGGLARAIKGYLEIETGLPDYPVAAPQITVTIDPSVANKSSYRPFIECAVVTMPLLDAAVLRALMKLQENLHWGIGRDRKLASIGIYDLETITPPISYSTIAPDGIKFCPLGRPGTAMTPAQILAEHPKGIAYAHLLEPLRAYPLLSDSKGQVLSMPPIINSDETKLREGSSRLFIDVTGITATDVQKSLKTLVTSLQEFGGQVQAVTMRSADTEIATPDLTPGEISIDIEAARKWLGLDLRAREILKYLGRMRFSATGKAPDYRVKYPAFRTDIKHEVDIFEDLAIAYDYQQIPLQMVPTMTIGQERPEEKLGRILAREIMLGLGFVEIFSLMLTTHEQHFQRLRCQPDSDHALLLNPKSVEHNVVRCHLLSGLLESLAKNKLKPVPQRFFEIGNVVLLASETETGTREEKRLAFAIIGPAAGYAEARSMVDAILYELGLNSEYQELEHPWFIDGRAASVAISRGTFRSCWRNSSGNFAKLRLELSRDNGRIDSGKAIWLRSRQEINWSVDELRKSSSVNLHHSFYREYHWKPKKKRKKKQKPATPCTAIGRVG